MARKGTLTVRLVGDKRPLEKTLGGVGKSLGGFVAKVGAAATAAAGVVAFKGVQAAREAAKINRITENVIKTTGGAAKVSARQVEELSGRLQKLTGVSDETIQRGSNMLLTFTNIRNEVGKNNKIFDQATAIALDLSVAMGTDVKDSAIQVGKALNDPIRGVSALSRVGIQFTDVQKDQIAVLMENNDILGAQKIILGELEKQFGGTAEAAADPMQKLQETIGDTVEVIGTALLPVVDRVATWLNDRLPQAVEFAQRAWQIFTGALEGSSYATVLAEQQGGIMEVVARLGETFRKVRDKVIKAVDAVKDWWDTNGPKIRAAVRDVADAVVEWWEGTGRDAVVEFGQAVQRFWRETVKPALNELQTAWNENKDTLAETWDSIKRILSELGELFATIFAEAESDVQSGTEGMSRDLGTLADSLATIADALADVLEWFNRNMETWRSIAGPIQFLTGWLDRVMSPLRQIRQALRDIDRLMNGLGNKSSFKGSGGKGSLVPAGLPGLAAGGVVTRPTVLMAGEGGESEAIVPLSRLEQMMGSPRAGGSTTVVNHFHFPNYAGSKQEIVDIAIDGFAQYTRRGGTIVANTVRQ